MSQPYEPDIGKINESIFARHELWPYNAFVEANWDLYATGYKNAANHLVEQAANAHEQDFMVYPTMFLYRHYLELRLKEVRLALRVYFDEPRELATHHDLLKLWREVRPLMEREWNTDESIANNDAVEARISEFDQIDKGSFSFRYPVTKDDIPSLKDLPGIDGQPMINLFQVRDVVGAVALLLDGASYGVSVNLDYKAEMQAEYAAERSRYEAEMRAEMQAEDAAERSQYEAEMRAEMQAEHAAERNQYEAETRAEMQAEYAAERSQYEAEMRAEMQAEYAAERSQYEAEMRAEMRAEYEAERGYDNEP